MLLFCFSGFTTTAQTQLWFNTAVKAHPADFTYPSSVNNDDFDNLPILQSTIGLSNQLNRSKWHMEYALSYFYTESRLRITQTTIDPFYGFLKTPRDGYFVESLNYVGVKIGSGPTFRLGRGLNNLSLPFGLQAFLPFSSKSFWQFGDKRSDLSPVYTGENFKYGVFYGLYFRPTYQFKLTQNRSSSWSFGVYAEGDLLILNESGSNPKWTTGGGLELRYSFGKRSGLPSGNLKF